MNRWMITDPWIFYGAGALLVVYLLYMMLRRPRADRKPSPDGEL